MKAIGCTGDGFIVQMSRHEFESITGEDVRGDKIQRGNHWYPAIDVEIAVSEAWGRIHALNENQPELQKAIRQLRAIADVLEPLELVVCPEIEQAAAAEGGASDA